MGDTYASSPDGRKDKSVGWDGKPRNNLKESHKAMSVVRRDKIKGIPQKCLCQIPQRFSIEMCNRGWILRNVIIWHKPNCMPSSVKDRFTVDFEYLYLFVKNKKYYFETQYENATYTDARKDNGNIKYNNRLTQCNVKVSDDRIKRCVWSISPKPYPEAHFAVYPTELLYTPIKAGCPKGGLVLDPFMGSGTTAWVARKFGRDYLGIELSPEYIKLAEKRLAQQILL